MNEYIKMNRKRKIKLEIKSKSKSKSKSKIKTKQKIKILKIYTQEIFIFNNILTYSLRVSK